jgi:hypothetical protein
MRGTAGRGQAVCPGGLQCGVPARWSRARAGIAAACLLLAACPKPDADGPLSTVRLTVSPLPASGRYAFDLRIERNRGPLPVGTTSAGAAATFDVILNGGDNDLAIQLLNGEPPAMYRMEVSGARFLYGEPHVVTGTLDRAGAVHTWTLRVPD